MPQFRFALCRVLANDAEVEFPSATFSLFSDITARSLSLCVVCLLHYCSFGRISKALFSVFLKLQVGESTLRCVSCLLLSIYCHQRCLSVCLSVVGWLSVVGCLCSDTVCVSEVTRVVAYFNQEPAAIVSSHLPKMGRLRTGVQGFRLAAAGSAESFASNRRVITADHHY